jgi:hypothetical protein
MPDINVSQPMTAVINEYLVPHVVDNAWVAQAGLRLLFQDGMAIHKMGCHYFNVEKKYI